MERPADNLEDFYRSCNPEQSLAGGRAHPFYVDLSEARGTASVTGRIRRAIRLADTPACKVLLTGHRGTGKTTELNSLTTDLESDGFLVVRFSGESEFNLNDVGWQDLVLELAAQVYEQGAEAAKRKRIRRSPDRRLMEKVEGYLDRTSLTRTERTTTEASTEGEAGLSAGPWPFLSLRTIFKNLAKSGSERTRQVRRDLEPRADQLIEDLNRFLQAFQNTLKAEGKKGLVVLIDGLEKMPLAESEQAVSSQERLFIHGAPRLKAPACHVVYTMPISLEYDHNLGGHYSEIEPLRLPMVRVRTRARQPDARGVSPMRALLAKRGELDRLADPEAVAELIDKSGGHVRDLLRLMRAACGAAMDAPVCY